VDAEQWRGGRGISVGERVVEQEATTSSGKSAGPAASMYPILRRGRTGRQAFHPGVGTSLLGVVRRSPSTGEWGVTTCQYGQIGHLLRGLTLLAE